MEDEKKRDDARFNKVGGVLGIDPKGNPVEKNPSYSLLYERIIQKVPTTNNHSESYHARINSIAADMRYSINNRLSLVVDHIMSRLTLLDALSIANLRNYLSITIFNIDTIVVGAIVAKVQSDLLRKNPELIAKIDSNFDKYLATLQL